MKFGVISKCVNSKNNKFFFMLIHEVTLYGITVAVWCDVLLVQLGLLGPFFYLRA
jgi:hypothetical protein